MYYIVETFFCFKNYNNFFFFYSIYGIWAPSSGKINIQKSSPLFMCLIVLPNKQNNSHTHCRLRVQNFFRIEGLLAPFFPLFNIIDINSIINHYIQGHTKSTHSKKNFSTFDFQTNYSLQKT